MFPKMQFRSIAFAKPVDGGRVLTMLALEFYDWDAQITQDRTETLISEGTIDSAFVEGLGCRFRRLDDNPEPAPLGEKNPLVNDGAMSSTARENAPTGARETVVLPEEQAERPGGPQIQGKRTKGRKKKGKKDKRDHKDDEHRKFIQKFPEDAAKNCMHEFPSILGTALTHDPYRDCVLTAASVFHCPISYMTVINSGNISRDCPPGPHLFIYRGYHKIGPTGVHCEDERNGHHCEFRVTDFHGQAYRKFCGIFAEDITKVLTHREFRCFAFMTNIDHCSMIRLFLDEEGGEQNFERAVRFFSAELSVTIEFDG